MTEVPSSDEFDRIGDVLRDSRVISESQAIEIQQYCEEHAVRFGEAALALGFIDRPTLDRAIATQFDLSMAPARGFDGADEPVAFTRPQSPEAEDYRSIRNALALRWFKHPEGAKTLAVVSPDRGDGRSLMAANLAICFAQVGFRTLLIDADMRNPSQHSLFKLDDRRGLAGILMGNVDDRAFCAIEGMPSLTVMPAGGLPPNPQELLLSPVLNRLAEEVRSRFEMIIFDTPAASAGSDYQIIGAEAVGALIVTHRKRTRTKRAKQLVAACRGFGMRIVGSTMTGLRG